MRRLEVGSDHMCISVTDWGQHCGLQLRVEGANTVAIADFEIDRKIAADLCAALGAWLERRPEP